MTRVLAIFLIALVAGCTSASEHPARRALSKSDYQALKQEFSRPAGGAVQRNRTYPVLEGTPPLAYLVTGDSTIRVFDATSRVVIASAAAPARSIVSVDAKRGVAIAGQTVNPGPLPSEHTYSIYAEPDFREGTTK